MPIADDLPRLQSNFLFRNIDLKALKSLLEECRYRQLGSGEVLLEPGNLNQSLYLILSGELRVYLGGRVLPQNAILVDGDCVGELSLIDGKGATALVLAAMPTELLVIPHDILWAMVDQCNAIARNLLHIISRRMRNENQILLMTQSQSREFEQAANLDALTGVHNRRWLAETFPRAMARCARDGHPSCLVMADVDHFKRYNDAHGHLVGDKVLRRVADLLAESLRTDDLIARYGGEEFAILLPNTGLEAGCAIAERLREKVAGMQVTRAEGGPVEPVTISCGVAALLSDCDLESLVARADEALYRAKEQGRNRVERAEDASAPVGVSDEP